MINIPYADVFNGLKKQQKAQRALGIVTLAVGAAIPALLVWMPTVGAPLSWSFDTVRYQLQTGGFWLFPGNAIFQHEDFIGSNIFETVLILLIILVVFWIILATLYSISTILLKLLFKQPLFSSTISMTTLVRPLPAKSILKYAITGQLGDDDLVIGISGELLVLSMSVPETFPTFLVDSVSDSIERKTGRRLVVENKERIILDGVSQEYIRIYALPGQSVNPTRLFGPDVEQLLIKQLAQATLYVEDGHIIALIGSKSIESASSLQNAVESFVALRRLLDSKMTNKAAKPEKDYSVRLGNKSFSVRHLPVISLRKSIIIVSLISIAIYTPAMIFNTTAPLDSVSVPVWIMMAFWLSVSWSKKRRTIGSTFSVSTDIKKGGGSQ